MRRNFIRSVILTTVAVVVLGALAGCGSSLVPPPIRYIEPSLPSAFKVGNLTINPSVVKAGVETVITAEVTNTGSADESYVGEVKVFEPQNAAGLPVPGQTPYSLRSDPGAWRNHHHHDSTYEVVWGETKRELTVNPEPGTPSSGNSQAPGPRRAPDFTAVDVVTGKNVSLGEFLGSPVLLNFVNYGCNPSVNDRVSVQLLAIKELKSQRPDLVPVSVFCGCCPPEVLRQFAKDNDLNWPWVLDSDYSIVSKYSAYLERYGYPTLVFIDKDQFISEVTGYSTLPVLTDKLNKLAPAGAKP